MYPKAIASVVTVTYMIGFGVGQAYAESPPAAVYTLDQALKQVRADELKQPTQSALSESVSFWSAVRSAVARSDQLIANDYALQAAQKQQVAAGQLPDPVLTLQINNLPLNGNDALAIGAEPITRRTVGVSQTWLSEGKRKASQAIQEGKGKQTTASNAKVSASVALGAAQAWLDVFFSLRTLRQYQAIRQELVAQAEAIKTLYQGNTAKQADIFLAEQELVLLELKESRARASLKAAQAMLNRWVGAELDLAQDFSDAPEYTKLSNQALSAIQHPEHLPALAELAAAEDIAKANLQLRTEQLTADWTTQLQLSKRGGQFSDTVSLMFSRPILVRPELNQVQLEAAAQAELDRLIALSRDSLRSETGRLQALQHNWEEGKSRIRLLREELLSLAKQRTLAATAAYQGGTGNLASVLMTRKAELDVELELINLSREVAQWWAALEFALPLQEINP